MFKNSHTRFSPSLHSFLPSLKAQQNYEMEFLNQEVTDEFQFMQTDSSTNTGSGLISIFKSFGSSTSKTKKLSKLGKHAKSKSKM